MYNKQFEEEFNEFEKEIDKKAEEYINSLKEQRQNFLSECNKLKADKINELKKKYHSNKEITGFERTNKYGIYYHIHNDNVEDYVEQFIDQDDIRYESANYGDERIMELTLMKEKLNRLLYRYSIESGGHSIDIENKIKTVYVIQYDTINDVFQVAGMCSGYIYTPERVLFTTKESAEQAIVLYSSLTREIIQKEKDNKDFYNNLNKERNEEYARK